MRTQGIAPWTIGLKGHRTAAVLHALSTKRLRRELNPQSPVLQTIPKPLWNLAKLSYFISYFVAYILFFKITGHSTNY